MALGQEEGRRALPDIDFSHVSFSYPASDAYGASLTGAGSDRVASDSPSSRTDAVLNDLSFSVESGQLVALVGNNGSGKSTIAKLCCAFLLPDSGSVEVRGIDVNSLDASGIQEFRQVAGMVFQSPDDQFVTSTVFDEVAFGPCNMGMSREEVCERVDRALAAVGMLGRFGCNVNRLSGGEKQRVAIADALAMRPEVLVLDEPTSMLDAASRKAVMDAVRALCDSGMTILLVTHDPEEALAADRVLVVENGKCREVGKDFLASLELDVERIARRVSMPDVDVGQLRGFAEPVQPSLKAATLQPEPSSSNVQSSRQSQPVRRLQPLISFNNVSFSYSGAEGFDAGMLGLRRQAGMGGCSAISGLSLEVFEGEAIAIMGPNGSGKSTALQLMNGLLQPTSGEVVVGGVPTSGRHGTNHARSVVGLCFQSPEEGFFAQTAYDEVAFAPRSKGLSCDEVERCVREALALVRLDFDSVARKSPFELSGGQRRRLALAAVLAMRPQVLVLDEPCSGLDCPSREALLETLLRLKQQGQAIVIVTHHEGEASLLADRIIRLG